MKDRDHTIEPLKKLIAESYGIEGQFQQLAGELDENFLVKTRSNKFIFKLMRQNCSFPLVDMQVAALEHLRLSDIEKKVPRVVATNDGDQIMRANIDGQKRFGWMTSHLRGAHPGSDRLINGQMAREIGSEFAKLDLALSDFKHNALKRELKWDLLNAQWIANNIDVHTTSTRRKIIGGIADAYLTSVKSLALKAPRAVIHNDANDMNILFSDVGASEKKLSGIIDFGDMVLSARICEPAIAAAYAMMFAHNALDCASNIISAYHEQYPLDETEIALFFPLILTRLAVSATNVAQGRVEDPTNTYLQISEQPAWSLLNQYHDADHHILEQIFRQACGLPTITTFVDVAALKAGRRKFFGASQSLSYDAPFTPTHAIDHHIVDSIGRTFLDAYNNVPHVGHSNAVVSDAVTRQLSLLINTNSRYLTEAPIRYADRLSEKLPASLCKFLFVNSASEANEIALRLARAATNKRDLIVMQHGYHGCTTGAIAISPYKFNHPLGGGAPEWVHEVPQPDLYRGDFWKTHPDKVKPYFSSLKETIASIDSENGLCGFISECLPSVGGQIVLPNDYLKTVYALVRKAGGVCIADDVQTGLGRLGEFFWGFEQQDTTPDILVLGKPLGNGFPIAAVITTTEIADAFASGPEFFSTFGGSSASCAAGLAVLDVIESDGLQDNARDIGQYLRDGFHSLARDHKVIGDIRGMGLFWGIDLIEDQKNRTPAKDSARRIKTALYHRHILVGTDGPYDNVLKIRPPMTFDREAADRLLNVLGECLDEEKLYSQKES